MFKNFEDLNDLQGSLVESSTAASVRGALGVQSDLLSVVHNAVNEYVDVYNKVRATRINPDTRTPEDVTDANFNSAPNNVLAQVRAQLTEKAQLLNIYVENINDEFEDVTVTGEGTLSSDEWTVVSQEPQIINVFGTNVSIQSTLSDWREGLVAAVKPVGTLDLSGNSFEQSFFALYGSKIVRDEYVDNVVASYAEYVKDDIHVVWGVGHNSSSRYVFAGAWDDSTGAAFVKTQNGNAQNQSGIHSTLNLLQNSGIIDPSIPHIETSTYGGVTKTAAPAVAMPTAVSGTFSVTLNPGVVIEQMFVSQESISDAIEALTGTSN